jgi:hypothetical protein
MRRTSSLRASLPSSKAVPANLRTLLGPDRFVRNVVWPPLRNRLTPRVRVLCGIHGSDIKDGLLLWSQVEPSAFLPRAGRGVNQAGLLC